MLHDLLQFHPALGYATAWVLPFLRVCLSSKSGQCSTDDGLNAGAPWARLHALLQFHPAFGYAMAYVLPFLRVCLSSKSGQCSTEDGLNAGAPFVIMSAVSPI